MSLGANHHPSDLHRGYSETRTRVLTSVNTAPKQQKRISLAAHYPIHQPSPLNCLLSDQAWTVATLEPVNEAWPEIHLHWLICCSRAIQVNWAMDIIIGFWVNNQDPVKMRFGLSYDGPKLVTYYLINSKFQKNNLFRMFVLLAFRETSTL